MKVFTSVRVAVSVLVLVLSGGTLPGAATPAKAIPSVGASRDVIVILRNQLPDMPPVRGARAARAAALAAAQAPIVSHLQASNASRVHAFAMINAVAATVSPAEAEALAAHPLVQAVVPDKILKLSRPSLETPRAKSAGSTAAAAPSVAPPEGSSGPCNTLEPEALQLTHAAYLDPTIPQAQRVLDGNGEFVTGKGVKVAFIADGLDTTIAGFVHTDGTPVFIDYQNFNGDPAGTPTAGGEAFGDASSIAAQDTPNGKPLLFDLSKFVNATHPLPSPCNIRIRGMAPGASLVGLNVFSSIGVSSTSNFVQAIEYAVLHDDVDVINESFGGNPFPDNDNDPISLADQAAVAGGVTVVVSSGDAGYNGTMGTPSTDAAVLSSGATTQFRSYAQAGYAGAVFATHGWISGNISAFSSGGFSMSGPRTPDTVAPGDLGWALCSTNTTLYQDCTNYATPAAPSPIQLFGGTSESSPLTAGAAALVIQAYRSTHGGASPTPALVKEILMSTATDLGAPPSEQGAGFINALAAVNAALSLGTGSGLLNNPTRASITDLPGTPETVSVAITNTGATTQHLVPSLQALGPAFAEQNLTVNLNPQTLPTYWSLGGIPRAYLIQQFTVPEGAQHLDAAIAWKAPFSGPAVSVELALVDPRGRNVAFSEPQGDSSGYGHVDVVSPAGGTWTAIISTDVPAIYAPYTGPVKFSWAVENYLTFGSVSPASLDLAPGATQWISARFRLPSQPGDSGVAIRFASSGGVPHSDIPIALRTLIPIGPNGGSFSGVMTGGNGRPTTGPTQTYAFDVPPGVNNMSLSLQDGDSFYVLEGLLIDPNGMQLSVEPNFDANGNNQPTMQLDRANPQPGRWRFILLVNYYSSGNEIRLPFTAQIGFNTAQVTASGLPNDPHIKLSASAPPLVVPITITNNAGLAEAYFADARLQGSTVLQFGTFPACTLDAGGPPLTELPYACFATFLPTQVTSVEFVAQAGAPINMDAFGNTGYVVGVTGAPDLYASTVGPDTVAASLTEPEVPWGEWVMVPSLIGPYGSSGAPPTPVATAAVLQLKPFDAAVTSNYGDLWSDVTFGTSTFTTGLVLSPGNTGTIQLSIAPSASQIGTTVRGFIYIDTFNGVVQTGDEVVRLPYSYTVVP
jgi:Subtilase family/Peptidase inhibitor I9